MRTVSTEEDHPTVSAARLYQHEEKAQEVASVSSKFTVFPRKRQKEQERVCLQNPRKRQRNASSVSNHPFIRLSLTATQLDFTHLRVLS